MSNLGDARREQAPANDIQKSYDTVAQEYADEIYAELAGKPFDREVLDRFAERVRGQGRVCDLGCGPAQVARYLRDRGVDAFGLDLSAGMLAQAQRLNPDLQFVQTSMLALGLGSEVLRGVAAFYCIIHIPRQKVVAALAELRRILQPGGCLLIAFHLGTEDSHHEELFGRPVSLDVVFFTTAEMNGYLQSAGFRVEEVLERNPFAPEVEYQSRRGYILALRP
ncbi:MAG: class I SAM-dependent methyltransferase [Terriglobales bacterium]